MAESNADLIGFTFESDGETWTVTGSTTFSANYVNVESESGGQSCRPAALVRQAKLWV